MANCLCLRRIGIALIVASLAPGPSASAKEYTSDQYGFRVSIPSGFNENPPRGLFNNVTQSAIVDYVEAAWDGKDIPIAISLRRTGIGYNPADKNAIRDAVLRKGWWNTTYDLRHWNDLNLQVFRQELSLNSTQTHVSYIIVFPLVGEGIVLVVQGPMRREKELVKVFDDCVRHFANLKPYVKIDWKFEDDSHSVGQILVKILLSAVSGALILFWFVKIGKAKSKARYQTPDAGTLDLDDVRASG